MNFSANEMAIFAKAMIANEFKCEIEDGSIRVSFPMAMAHDDGDGVEVYIELIDGEWYATDKGTALGSAFNLHYELIDTPKGQKKIAQIMEWYGITAGERGWMKKIEFGHDGEFRPNSISEAVFSMGMASLALDTLDRDC